MQLVKLEIFSPMRIVGVDCLSKINNVVEIVIGWKYKKWIKCDSLPISSDFCMLTELCYQIHSILPYA